MTKEELKQYIDDNIYENQDGEITAESLNAVLKAIVDDGGTQVEANPEGGGKPSILQRIKIDDEIYLAPIGPQGDPGAPGDNAYIHIKYAASVPTSDSDMHATPQSGDKFIGIYSGDSSTPPTSHTSYMWSKYVGENGAPGPQGEQGIQGETGATGAPGPANTLSIGTVTDGEQASASITGNAPSQTLNLVLPKGEKGDTGNDAVNPFKGWYASANTLPANPVVGDYAYVKGANASDPVAIYECTTAGTWSDSGRTADTSNVQTFASGEEVNEVHIVNDLTTGGTTDVLSAEQGKELADITTEVIFSLNLLNPQTIDTQHYIDRRTGLESTNNLSSIIFGCTDYFEIPEVGLICNHCPIAAGNGGGTCYIYDSEKNPITVININTPGGSIAINKTNHPDWSFVRFNLATGYNSLQDDGYAVYKGTTLPLSFIPYTDPTRVMKKQEIDNESITSQKIKNGAVTIDKIEKTATEYLSDNICNPNECYFGNDKYIENDTGNVSSFTSPLLGGYTGYIPIDNRGLAFTNIHYGGNDVGGAVYYVDANGTKRYKRSAGCTGIVSYDAGDSSLPETNPLHYPDAFVRFTLAAGVTANNVMVNVGTKTLPYTTYIGTRKVISPEILPDSNKEIESILEGKKIFAGSLDLLLPTRFYYVKGDTLQLFHKGIVKAIGLENRYVKPTCEIGTPYRRYIQFNSSLQTTIGDKTISFTIYDDNQNILGSGSSKIKVVNTPVSPASEKHILCIGASTTGGGQWVCEAQRRLLASDGTPQGNGLSNLVFVGKQSKTLYGQTAHLQGNSGWAWQDFATEGRGALTFRFYLSGSGNPVVQGNQYTNNGHTYTVTEVYTIEGVETIKCSTDAATSTPTSSGTLTPITGATYPALTFTSVEQDSANPFWDSINHKLDFTSYVNSYCGGSVDIVYTVLGVNAMFQGVDVQEGYVRTFIEALHDEYPNCTIILATDALPSMVDMMPGYGASDNRFSNTYKVLCEMHKVFQMYKKLELEYTTRTEDPIQVEFESWCAQVDSDYNFPLIQKDVNTRNSSVKEPYASNTIHPGNGTSQDDARGYMQLADAAYRSIVAHLCQ
jgi:hypothetical protein